MVLFFLVFGPMEMFYSHARGFQFFDVLFGILLEFLRTHRTAEIDALTIVVSKQLLVDLPSNDRTGDLQLLLLVLALVFSVMLLCCGKSSCDEHTCEDCNCNNRVFHHLLLY